MKFSKILAGIQEQPWYRAFLAPAINEIQPNSRLLDVGTGPGKLLQILADEKNVEGVGVDTEEEMLQAAREKLKGRDVELFKSYPGMEFPLDDNSFNYITFCSVLFLLEEKDAEQLLDDALRILKKKGKIIILTPTGAGNLLILTKRFFSLKNFSIYMWYNATRRRGRQWSENNFLTQYAKKNHIGYGREIVMDGFALLEILYV